MVATDVTQTLTASEVTDIISNALASIQTSNSTVVSDNSTVVQWNSDSEGCKNINISKSKTTYQASSSLYTDMSTVQTVYAKIVNDLTTSNTQSTTGASGWWDSNDVETQDTIMNMLQTSLTQEVIVNYTNTFMSTTVNVQVCTGSAGGINFIRGTRNQIYNICYDQYSQMSQVQQVSADIANTLSATQDVKKTSILAVIMRAIALICIVIIIIVAVVVAVIIMGFLK